MSTHMAALRWILLGAGLIFLAALAAWELRRPRQGAQRGDAARDAPGEATGSGQAAGSSPAAGPAGPAGIWGTRQRTSAPPRVELPPLEPEIAFTPTDYAGPDPQALVESPHDGPHDGGPHDGGPHDRSHDAPHEGKAASLLSPQDRPVRVQWPPEDERSVLALRIVPGGEEPLSGRSVRQSLGACGFVHGPLQIFHQPAEDGRALLSAASLRIPGTLDPATMDFQRFAGLSLFTVLPGPLEAPAALDHLVHTARDLTQRLHARLQDEQGAPLDATRLESLRRTAQGLPGPRPRAEPAA